MFFLHISFFLCTFVVSKTNNNMFNLITEKKMKDRLEKIKKDLSDYIKIARDLNFPKEEQERHIDMMLDDINKLKKKL